MKKLTANKAYLVFYAFDIVLLIVVAVFLLPFSKNNNSPNSKNAAFIEAEQLKDITEIRILDKNAKCRVSMHRIGGQWMGTDSFSNDSLYWPADNKTVENFLVQMSTEIPWTKKASNITSWKKLGVDASNAVEVDLRIDSKTAASLFFGYADDLNGEIYFRTSKESTVWQAKTDVENFVYEKNASFWADPFLIPLCIRNKAENRDSGLRRGELAYIKPAEHVKPIKILKKSFDSGYTGVYSFYEKDDQIVVIPEFSGNDYAELISYRYTISKWTYEKFVAQLEENK